MRKTALAFAAFALIGALFAQPRRTEPVLPGKIILAFAEKEAAFREMFGKYTYTQRVTFQVLRTDGTAREERRMLSEVFFDSQGRRQQRVVSDEGGLTSVTITQQDIDNVLNLQPFVMTTADLDYYKVGYEGRERVDELDTYVFAIRPRRMDPGQRYFQGRIWVDQQDLQVVMTRGKPVPEPRGQKFPRFETVRQQIDGEYWFPVWSLADDILDFDNGNRVHIRILTTWEDFQEFQVSTKVRYQGEADDEKKDPPPR